LFLECLLSCNNIEKNNTEIIGNPIEKEFFVNLKWDMKPYNCYKTKENDDSYNNCNRLNDNNINKKNNYDNNYNIIDKQIIDIYPNNYFKITESLNNVNKKENKSKFLKRSYTFYSDCSDKEIKDDSLPNNELNYIKDNISKNESKAYILRVYKRFIKSGTLNSSAITYNFITKELRFMTKGLSEEILDKCDINSLPDNIVNIFSLYRRLGFTIIICATKIIKVDDYNDSTPIDDYMNNLTFCGFVTLKNKFKESVLNSIKDLKKFNCDLIITTGDNVYNTLSIGFASSIIGNKNKNVFSLDKDDKNRIIITKLYGIKKIDEEEKDFKENKSLLDKLSKPSAKGLSKESCKSKESFPIGRLKRNRSHYEKYRFNLDSEKRKLNPDKRKTVKRSIERKEKIQEKYEKLFDKSPRFFSINTDTNENNKEIDMNLNSNIFNKSIVSEKIQKMNSSRKSKSLLVKEILSNKSNKNRDRKCNELNNIYYYYPEIFEENEDFSNDPKYCISGKAFNFLYKNKDKKNCKYFLEKINKNIKIFY
jgi:magnesium-transporting ATPase (P-type)